MPAAMNGKGLNVPKVLGLSDDPQLGQWFCSMSYIRIILVAAGSRFSVSLTHINWM